jgi:hypothetical protein
VKKFFSQEETDEFLQDLSTRMNKINALEDSEQRRKASFRMNVEFVSKHPMVAKAEEKASMLLEKEVVGFYPVLFQNNAFSTSLPPHQDTAFDVLLGKHDFYQYWFKVREGNGIAIAPRSKNEKLYQKIDSFGFPCCLKYSNRNTFEIHRQFGKNTGEELLVKDVVMEDVESEVGDLVCFKTDVLHFTLPPKSLSENRLAIGLRVLPKELKISLSDMAKLVERNLKHELNPVTLHRFYVSPLLLAIQEKSEIVTWKHFLEAREKAEE